MVIDIASPEIARRIRRMSHSYEGALGFSDNLLIGPSSADLAHHAELRYQYWRGMPGAARSLRTMYAKLGESLSSADEVTVWSSGSLQHAALLWMICGILGDRPATEVRVISFARVEQLPNDQFGCIECELRTDRIRGPRDSGEKFGIGLRRTAARNWRAFTGARVTAFNERCHVPTLGLARMGKYHAGFFPRVTAGGLRVSLFDELLLTCVGSAWSLPSEILLRRSQEGMTLRSALIASHRFVDCYGDCNVKHGC